MAKRRATRRRTTATKKAVPYKPPKQEGPSFSCDAIVCMGATSYNIRVAIEELAIQNAKGENPVPRKAVLEALKSLRLLKYADEEEWFKELDKND